MSPSEDPRIQLRKDGAIAHLQLNRPEKRNALDVAMLEALAARCMQIEHDPDLDVVLLSGAGAAFCAGGDIAAWAGLSPEAFGRHWIRDGHRALDALARLRQPVIAVLDGPVLGGGLELAVCADYRIAERQITLGQPETALGIIPGWSGTQRAVRRYGAQTVRRMALFGEVFSAEEALRLGLVDRLVDPGAAQGEAQRLAQSLLNRSARATELTKMMIAAAEAEETDRIFDALAGTIAAGTPELQDRLPKKYKPTR